LLVSVVWLGLGFVLGREYNLVLRDSLGQQLTASKGESEPLRGGMALLRRAIAGEKLGPLLSVLEVLRSADLRHCEPLLISLLDHPSSEVVKLSCELLARQAPDALGKALLARLEKPLASPPDNVAIWLRMLG